MMKTMKLKEMQEQTEPQDLVTELQNEVSHLKKLLVAKEEEINQQDRKRHIRAAAEIEVIALLTSTEEELQDCNQRCADLEEKIGRADSHQGLEDGDHLRGRQSKNMEMLIQELSMKEEALRLQLFNEKKQMEEDMRTRLKSMEEDFQRELSEKKELNKKMLREREESTRQLLKDGVESFNRQLSVFCQHWETSAQQWEKKQMELQDRILEVLNLQAQRREEHRQETQRLREEIQQLQVNNSTFVLPLQVSKSFTL